jgi:hypothetical protein
MMPEAHERGRRRRHVEKPQTICGLRKVERATKLSVRHAQKQARQRPPTSIAVPVSGFIRPARSFGITAGITGTEFELLREAKSPALAGLSCAREDSNLHPVKPGQGPQPCQACDRIVRTVHMQGVFRGR